jgi:hypothetical protein
MKNYFTYYNSSLIVLSKYNLSNNSLYELYLLRKKYVDNNNYIIENMLSKVLNIIDDVIISKTNGIKLLEILEENEILCEIIVKDTELIELTDNYKLLELFKNINIMEEIFEFSKDSLLNFEQIKIRNCLTIKYIFNIIKEKILLCKW